MTPEQRTEQQGFAVLAVLVFCIIGVYLACDPFHFIEAQNKKFEADRLEDIRIKEEPHKLYLAWCRLHPEQKRTEEEWLLLFKHDMLPK